MKPAMTKEEQAKLGELLNVAHVILNTVKRTIDEHYSVDAEQVKMLASVTSHD